MTKTGGRDPADAMEKMNLIEGTIASADASSKIGAIRWLHDFLLGEGVTTDFGRRALQLMFLFTRDGDPEVRAEVMSRLPREEFRPLDEAKLVPTGVGAQFSVAEEPSVTKLATRTEPDPEERTQEQKARVEESRRHFIRGASLVEKGDLSGALSEFEASVAANPEFARGYLMIGEVKESMAEPKAAEEGYRASIERDPDIVEARQRLARLLVKTGRPEQAVEHLRHVVLISPTDWRSRCELDRLLIQTRRIEEAGKDLARVIANRPDLAEAHGLMGLIRYYEGKPEEAQSELETAIRLRPQDLTDQSVYHFFLGLVRQARDDREGALRDLRSALYYNPANTMARSEMHLLTGRVLASKGKLSEARQALQSAIACDPSYAEMRDARMELDALPPR